MTEETIPKVEKHVFEVVHKLSPRALPLASDALSKKIHVFLNDVSKASRSRLIKKGINEITKSINRGQSRMVFISGDVSPIEIVLPLKTLCEQNAIPFIFIESGKALGEALGLSRYISAAGMVEGSEFNTNKKAILQIEKEINN